MASESGVGGLSRRRLLAVAAACASVGLARPSFARKSADDDAVKLIENLTGRSRLLRIAFASRCRRCFRTATPFLCRSTSTAR